MPAMQQKPNKLKSRLGRGLSSLISVSEPDVEMGMEEAAAGEAGETATGAAAEGSARPTAGLVELSLELIDPNPHQPRRSFDEAALVDLAASMKTTGLIQ